tara:strand:+ start:374 stop:1294 length:921 start_codon:yes stop_codon:yes gene_type:complete
MQLFKNKILLLKACRPNQWTKNLIIFSAPLFAFKYSSEIWIPSIYATFSFCLISSAIYLINDVLDIETDKKHPVKCNRPIASGKVNIKTAIFASFILGCLSILISIRINLGLSFLIFLYAFIQFIYCIKLKKKPLLDIFCISSGFLIRSLAGLVSSDLKLSPWFILSIGLLALFLAVEKRKAELMIIESRSIVTREVLKFYSLPLLLRLESSLATSAFMSYSLWASGPLLNGAPTSLMLITVPFVLLGIFRYQMLSDPYYPLNKSKKIKYFTEQPESVLLKDQGIKTIVLAWLLLTILIGFVNAKF